MRNCIEMTGLLVRNTWLRWGLFAMVAAVLLIPTNATEARPRPRPPRTFELIYGWSLTDVNDLVPGWPTAQLILHGNGTFDVYDMGSGEYTPNAGTYSEGRRGRTIEFVTYVGTIYSGDRQSDGSYHGTMVSGVSSTSGLTGVWMGEFIP